ncbi:MAG: SDR family NAD(P)-dependent oxidoreductase [Cyanobacteria bacterium K_DeepCast_35m_m2_023]|nr:SDR family NAD(P)-dependent oxidoreductase [Cyanobacteria bacterium K_DeepCast_35m_m2_023]
MAIDPPRNIVLSGGSSGIGLEAARQLLEAGHRLTVLCRDGRATAGLRQGLGGALHTPIADLADLQSVARCARGLLEAGEPIDTLVLNAGMQYTGAAQPRWSAQGFELTIAVNHLAHQALLQHLLPLLRAAPAPRLVVTTSEVHDPSSSGGRVGEPAGLGQLDGLRHGPGAVMLDGRSRFNAEKAYKDSKLCNLLMARWAARREPIAVVAWSPGLVIPRSPGGFFRDSRRHNPIGQALFALVARDLLKLTESVERAGALLAALATEAAHGAPGFRYWSNRVLGPGQLRFEQREPSPEARDDGLAEALWQLSAQAAGLQA